jgi:hypothetical protein
MPSPVFQKGNTLGRKKGVPNKATKTLKEFLVAFTEEKQDEIIQAFSELDAKDKISAWVAMIKYVLPTKATIELEKIVDNSLDGLTYEQIVSIEESNQRLIENYKSNNGG